MDPRDCPPFHICISDRMSSRNVAMEYFKLRGLWVTHLRLHFCVEVEDAIVVGAQDNFIDCSNN